MDLSTALLDDLLHLSRSVGLDDNELSARWTALVQALRAAVPSYRGIDLTLHDGEQPVRLAAFPDTGNGVITTSLRLPLVVLGAASHRESRVIFYAATPGAFVDLAADLGHALQTPVTTHDPGGRDGHGSILLDGDLPPRSLASGLTGLDEASSINRAIGILIDQGHPPEEAEGVLRRHAAAAGVEPHVYAARMLRH